MLLGIAGCFPDVPKLFPSCPPAAPRLLPGIAASSKDACPPELAEPAELADMFDEIDIEKNILEL